MWHILWWTTVQPAVIVGFTLNTLPKMSTDLQWLLVRKYNSFMRPARNGPVFSAEKVRGDSEGG